MRKTQAKIFKELSQNPPYVPFTFRELVAIQIIIGGYTRYIVSLPSSPEKEKRREILSSVSKRLQTQLCTLEQGRLIQLVLASEEVAELLAAMEGFIEQAQHSFPQNEQPQVIHTVNSWRLRLLEIVSEDYA